MKRSQLDPVPVYFDRYINKCDDIELIDVIQKSIEELDHLPLAKLIALGNRAYAPGKWSVKEILQHVIDTERIFTYRAMAFARNETQPLPSFSEDEYVLASDATNRTIEDLVQELKTTRLSFLSLFQSFTPAMLGKTGMGFKGPYSVASIGFIIPGHQRWHLQVIEDKYYSLLNG